MTLEEAIVEYHLQLAGQEADAIREVLAVLGVSAAEIEKAIDQYAGKGDTLPDGWWLPLIPALTSIRARLRSRLFAVVWLRITVITGVSVEALEKAMEAAGYDGPLRPTSGEKITNAAMAGPNGHEWPEYAARDLDAMFHRLSGQFRTARTREEVVDLIERARRLAGAALASTVVTAMHSAVNRVRLVVAGEDGRFTHWRYAAVLDSRTSHTCRTLNGTTWRFNDPNAPYPPRHPNCRSIVVPLVESPQ